MDLTDSKNFIGLLAVVVPAVLWGLSAIGSIRVRFEEADAARWRRIGELGKFLTNAGNATGEWAQLAAIGELGAMRGRQKRVARAILADARTLWSANHPKLIKAIDEAIS